MARKYLRSRQRGQGLAEYALVLALVALVVIVAAFAVGLAVQRVYGVVVGGLGTKRNATGVIEIISAQCIADPHQGTNGLTGLVVYGNTTEDPANLTGSTNQAVGTGIDGDDAPVTDNAGAPNSFLFNPLLAYKADVSVCPQAVVIQGKDGAIAVSPVSKSTIP